MTITNLKGEKLDKKIISLMAEIYFKDLSIIEEVDKKAKLEKLMDLRDIELGIEPVSRNLIDLSEKTERVLKDYRKLVKELKKK